MRYFVTGCAGFIGSNLVDRLLALAHTVVGYDNFSTGFDQFLTQASKSDRFCLHRQDMLDTAALTKAMNGCDFVFHLGANADVRFGFEHPNKDLEQNVIATFNVLEAMRKNKIKDIVFTSTGSIYGEAILIPTPENSPFPVQTSLYGASKLAAEGLISAYAEGYGFKGWVFRFVSILGERYSHGHVFDFYKRLLDNPKELYVLGDGHQRKSYLYIEDCIDAMLVAIEKLQDKVNIVNLGTNEHCEVNDSIAWITDYLGLKPALKYAGGQRGWIGDNPFIFLDCKKINNLGWHPRLTIKQAVIRTLDYIVANKWMLNKR